MPPLCAWQAPHLLPAQEHPAASNFPWAAAELGGGRACCVGGRWAGEEMGGGRGWVEGGDGGGDGWGPATLQMPISGVMPPGHPEWFPESAPLLTAWCRDL